MANVTQWLTWS